MPHPPRRHTIEDHLLGALSGHAHEGNEDHDHKHDEDPRHDLIESRSRALEGAPFVSIGIDVGSAGTQVVFSRLTMRGPGEPVSLRRLVKSRETIFMSPVSLTPWREGGIDAGALRAIVDQAFDESGVSPDDVETGAVILTGEAAAAANARPILDALAEQTGDLVAAAAGHHMEAMLAAWGSGAIRRSLERRGAVVLLDLGGGTAKLALCEEGKAQRSGALRIGSRLAVFDDGGAIVRLHQDGARLARAAGLDWSLGGRVSRSEIEHLAGRLADLLILALTAPHDRELADLWLTEPLAPAPAMSGLMLSGGVAEFVYGRETRDFGDLGLSLGTALRARLEAGRAPYVLLPPGECIRATVLGASEHSMQVSGETSFISAPGRLLPRRNLQVVAPIFAFEEVIHARALADAIAERRRMFDLAGIEREFALALRWRGDPDHARLIACARGLAWGLADMIAAGRPLFILTEGDAALNLAGALRQEVGVHNDLLILDGVVLRDFDFVDIGRLRLPSNTVPVTVKTLLFSPRQAQS